MIAPEEGRSGNGETSRLVLLRNNLLVSALIFALLQLWRPHFFSTDDNLDGGLPFFTEMGRHLLAGQSPFYSDDLFGGHYNMLRDPIFFAWHPQYLLVSLLAGTPLHWWIIDVNAFIFVMLATAGFVNLAWYVRRELALTVGDGWLMFYTMSFVYSMIALATGASWLDFLGNQSALPWLLLGILLRDGWRGAGLVALFNTHQILGGHLEPTISGNLFLTLFALAMSLERRSIVPLRSWVIGSAIAVLVALPFLLPALQGFTHSYRAQGVGLTDMQNNNIDALDFPTSFFLGMALWFIHPPQAHFAETYTLALGSCAAAWCFLPAVARWTSWTRFEAVLMGMLVVIGIFIMRPLWISQVMLHLPLLKSMRWPFREFLQFQLFFHLFLVVRRPALTPRARLIFALVGVLLYVPPGLIHQPPTFAQMSWDRRILFSAAFDEYWDKVRPLLGPNDRIAVIIPPKLYLDESLPKTYSLLGTYNYAELARVKNVWGWSQTPPKDEFDVHVLPLYVFGAYTPEQVGRLQGEKPPLRFLSLVSLQPLKITLSAPASLGSSPPQPPDIDLTPFVPPAFRNP